MRAGAVSGCVPTRTGIIQHYDLGYCGGGHFDIKPFSKTATIHIVTARGYLSDGPNVRAKTARWLDIWSIPHDTLTFSKDKTVVRTDWFVDDNADNIRAVNAAGSRGVLMHQTWNEDAHDLERVDTITAFAKTVLEEA